MEERLETLQEPWTSFVVEFPTFPKLLIHGREETQKILFLSPRAETNPTELCLALFGSQILMYRLNQGGASDALSSAGFIFVYSAEAPEALRSVLAPYKSMTNAPVLVAQKTNVVKTAQFVTEFLNRAGLASLGKNRSWADQPTQVNQGGGAQLDSGLTAMPSDAQLWTKNLPEISMVDDGGNTIHAAATLQDYRAEYACRFVLAHFDENINRDKMAEMVNLSPGYFSNLFRSEVGMSFSDYLIQVRIENAKSFLRRFDLSVEAISKKCGFNSLAHFSRTFKDRCGLSPLKFRKSPHAVT